MVFYENFQSTKQILIRPEIKNGFYIVELQVENERLYYNLLKQ